MSEKKGKGLSRRKFLGRVGTGIAGSYAMVPALKALPQQLKDEVEAFEEGREVLSVTVNGKKYVKQIKPTMTLAEFLREELELTGTKIVCNHGECGGCTVVLDGKAVYSCHMLAMDADGKEVTTVEGLMDGEKLHPVQEAFVEGDGLQCGFCTPGQVMAAYALLQANPKPNRQEALVGMSGNLCRCSAYPKIIDSVMIASEKMKA